MTTYALVIDDERSVDLVRASDSILRIYNNVKHARDNWEAKQIVMEHGFPGHLALDYILFSANSFEHATTEKFMQFLTSYARRNPEKIAYFSWNIHSQHEDAQRVLEPYIERLEDMVAKASAQ